jgi:hypothetical protein
MTAPLLLLPQLDYSNFFVQEKVQVPLLLHSINAKCVVVLSDVNPR